MKQKRQIGILFILIVAAAIVWGWNFHDKRVVTADAGPNPQDPPMVNVENPHIRMEEMGRARNAEYRSSGRNPFSPTAPPPSQAKTGQVEKKKFENYGPQPKPPDPPPPPLTLGNIKFYGYGSVSGAARRAFFTDGDGEVQIVGEGDVLLKRFRIIRIGNDHIEFEEISTGRVATAPLEEQAPSPQQ